jgi:hypothetical protein
MKSVLALHSVKYPRTHDLSLLLELLESAGLATPPHADKLPDLTVFGVPLRYGDLPSPIPPELDPQWAQAVAHAIVGWAGTILEGADT